MRQTILVITGSLKYFQQLLFYDSTYFLLHTHASRVTEINLYWTPFQASATFQFRASVIVFRSIVNGAVAHRSFRFVFIRCYDVSAEKKAETIQSRRLFFRHELLCQFHLRHDRFEFFVVDFSVATRVNKPNDRVEIFFGKHSFRECLQVRFVDESRIVLVQGLEHGFVVGVV